MSYDIDDLYFDGLFFIIGNELKMLASQIVIVLVATFVCFVPEAFAYIDPGTGSVILQGILAAISALITGVFAFRGFITRFFRRFISKKWFGSRDN